MLSVIIPARNEESAIVQTIESIISNLKVAHIEHEIIVINDGITIHSSCFYYWSI